MRSLSDGIVFGRKLATEYTELYRKYVPGCEDVELLTTSPLMGVRDSRRIVGEFELKIEDFLARRQFADQVAVYNWPTDVHPRDTSRKEYERFMKDFHSKDNLGRGECVGIPHDILVPRGWENLWVAGRCHSSDTKVRIDSRAIDRVHDGPGRRYRRGAIDPHRQPGNDLDTGAMVETLRSAGAFLPQREVARGITRA